MFCEDTGNRLSKRHNLVIGDEINQNLCLLWNSAETATNKDHEALDFLAINQALLSEEAQVVHLDEAASVLFAARESNLELAPEILYIVMTEQEFKEGIAVRR